MAAAGTPVGNGPSINALAAAAAASSSSAASASAAAPPGGAPNVQLINEIKAGKFAQLSLDRYARRMKKRFTLLNVDHGIDFKGNIRDVAKTVQAAIDSLKEHELTNHQKEQLQRIVLELKDINKNIDQGQIEKWETTIEIGNKAKAFFESLPKEEQAAQLQQAKAGKTARMRERLQARTREITELKKSKNIDTTKLTELRDKKSEIADKIEKNLATLELAVVPKVGQSAEQRLQVYEILNSERKELYDEMIKVEKAIGNLGKELDPEKSEDLQRYKRKLDTISLLANSFGTIAKIDTLSHFLSESASEIATEDEASSSSSASVSSSSSETSDED